MTRWYCDILTLGDKSTRRLPVLHKSLVPSQSIQIWKHFWESETFIFERTSVVFFWSLLSGQKFVFYFWGKLFPSHLREAGYGYLCWNLKNPVPSLQEDVPDLFSCLPTSEDLFPSYNLLAASVCFLAPNLSAPWNYKSYQEMGQACLVHSIILDGVKRLVPSTYLVMEVHSLRFWLFC